MLQGQVARTAPTLVASTGQAGVATLTLFATVASVRQCDCPLVSSIPNPPFPPIDPITKFAHVMLNRCREKRFIEKST